MKKYKICSCGYFVSENVNGQTNRAISVTKAITERYGEDKVVQISYHNIKKKPLLFLTRFINLSKNSENVVIFPDRNAIHFFAPLLCILKKIYGLRIFYCVIGGWLPDCLNKERFLLKCLQKFDGLFVETSHLRDSLIKLGLKRIYIFPNFKDVRCLGPDDIKKDVSWPVKLCFSSRILEQKGVREMVEKVLEINRDKILCTLDIYGPIDNRYRKTFDRLKSTFDESIVYKGITETMETTKILRRYDLQLFPTKFRTEGFPGSIADSFYAGLPVLASAWNSCKDVITENESGMIFEFCDFKDMKEKLLFLINNPELIQKMRLGCVYAGQKISQDQVIHIITDVFDDLYKEGV